MKTNDKKLIPVARLLRLGVDLFSSHFTSKGCCHSLTNHHIKQAHRGGPDKQLFLSQLLGRIVQSINISLRLNHDKHMVFPAPLPSTSTRICAQLIPEALKPTSFVLNAVFENIPNNTVVKIQLTKIPELVEKSVTNLSSKANTPPFLSPSFSIGCCQGVPVQATVSYGFTFKLTPLSLAHVDAALEHCKHV
jgi:hypothetical protein